MNCNAFVCIWFNFSCICGIAPLLFARFGFLLYLCKMKISDSEIDQRVARAQELFEQGFNCCQSVFAACADLYGIADESLALRLSASFGAGMGRMRLTCGAVSGTFLLAGLHNGSAVVGDREGKKNNYALVQDLAARFKAENGSIICAELLGIAPRPQEPTPAERTSDYYKKRPCVELVKQAVRVALTTMRTED